MSSLPTETGNDGFPAGEAWLPFRSRPRVPLDLLLLTTVWAASLLFVNPVGDFPLNDDWSFGQTVKRLLETGRFQPTGWTSMPLITQTLWGSLFCLPHGFSFTALRLSSQAWSLCAVLVTYLLARQVHPSRLVAICSALTLGLNPVFYALSNTFMTDVPFIGLLLCAILFWCRHLSTGSDLDWACGLACALAATLCRQLGLAAPAAFLVCLLWRRGLSARWLFRAVIPLGICAGGLLAFNHWLRVTGRMPALYSAKNDLVLETIRSPAHLAFEAARHAGTGFLYLGWFSLPVVALLLPRALREKDRWWVKAAAGSAGLIFVLAATLALMRDKILMPTAGNIVQVHGIGPLTLRDVHVLHLAHVPAISKAWWLAVTVAALAGGAILVAGTVRMALRWRSRRLARMPREQPAGSLCLLCAGIYLSPILTLGGFDRYYLPALPLLFIGMAALAAPAWQGVTRIRTLTAALLLGSLALFALLGTRDYLMWNRARWSVLNELLGSGMATAGDVDGGFEFNGWYLYDPAYERKPGLSDYWVKGDSYVVAFGDIPGYTALKEVRYTRWLPPGTGRIVLLKKTSLDGSDPPRTTAPNERPLP